MFIDVLSCSQFTEADLLSATGLTFGQAKGMIDRSQVRLSRNHFPGAGKRRMFCGADLIRFAVAKAAGEIGFPLRWSYLLSDAAVTRAEFRIMFPSTERAVPMFLATFPLENGDWGRVIIENDEDAKLLPPAFQAFAIDRLIDETLAKILAIVAGQPLPSFPIPAIPVQNPWGPETDFFRRWAKDSEGRNIYQGLTFDETLELETLRALWLKDYTQKPAENGSIKVLYTEADAARTDELEEIHRIAHAECEREFYSETPPKIVSEAE